MARLGKLKLKIICKILSLLKCQTLIFWKSHSYSKISLSQGRLSKRTSRNIFALEVITLKKYDVFSVVPEYLWMCRKDIEIPATDLSLLTFNKEMWHTDSCTLPMHISGAKYLYVCDLGVYSWGLYRTSLANFSQITVRNSKWLTCAKQKKIYIKISNIFFETRYILLHIFNYYF